MRLDAFENYIRGMITTSRQEKIKHFHDAIRLDPGYYEAMLQLGHTHYDNREYDPAASWFSRIPRSSPYGNEAAFFYGLSEYYLGEYSKSEEAFQYLAGTLPLTEVYNNFAVAAGHRGKHAEIDYLQSGYCRSQRSRLPLQPRCRLLPRWPDHCCVPPVERSPEPATF